MGGGRKDPLIDRLRPHENECLASSDRKREAFMTKFQKRGPPAKATASLRVSRAAAVAMIAGSSESSSAPRCWRPLSLWLPCPRGRYLAAEVASRAKKAGRSVLWCAPVRNRPGLAAVQASRHRRLATAARTRSISRARLPIKASCATPGSTPIMDCWPRATLIKRSCCPGPSSSPTTPAARIGCGPASTRSGFAR